MSTPSARAAKYRGVRPLPPRVSPSAAPLTPQATVLDLDPPPALSLHPATPIAHALLAAFERDYTHLTVVDDARALLGYVAIPRLRAALADGRVGDADTLAAAMQRFERGRRR